MKFADGRKASSYYKVKLNLIIKGIQRSLYAVVVGGKTPYSVLLGSLALYSFYTNADYIRVPAAYTVREEPTSRPTLVVREHLTIYLGRYYKSREDEAILLTNKLPNKRS
jgi:hypothetical protein